MLENRDYFETYLERFPDAPSLVIVRSVEAKHFPKDFLRQPVLDLCCGDGFFCKCLGLSQIYGCDIDESAIRKAKDTGVYLETKVSDIRNLSGYPDAYFETAISNCALEHVDGIHRALANVGRVLRNGGYLVMSVPADNFNSWYLPKVICEKLGFGNYGRTLLGKYNKRQSIFNIYPVSIWKQKLEDAGFRIEKHFFLYSQKEYMLVTFLDSLGGSFLGKLHSIFRKLTPTVLRKVMWRKVLKPIYLNSKPIDFGGELVIVAEKK